MLPCILVNCHRVTKHETRLQQLCFRIVQCVHAEFGEHNEPEIEVIGSKRILWVIPKIAIKIRWGSKREAFGGLLLEESNIWEIITSIHFLNDSEWLEEQNEAFVFQLHSGDEKNSIGKISISKWCALRFACFSLLRGIPLLFSICSCFFLHLNWVSFQTSATVSWIAFGGEASFHRFFKALGKLVVLLSTHS